MSNYEKPYAEIASMGRGAGTQDAYTVAFEPSVKVTPVAEGLRVLQHKAGVCIKRIASGTKAMTGFVNIAEWRVMMAIAKMCLEKITFNGASKESPATSFIFKMGKFKGKSPAQVLLDGSGTEADLTSQREFLAKNATGKFKEANEAGMAAIDDAIAKNKAGTLSKEDLTTGCIKVFESGPRYFVKKDRQPYNTDGWEFNISCYPGEKNPWKIEWVSKQVTINENMITAASNVVSQSASLTTTEFWDAVTECDEIFEDVQSSLRLERIKYMDAHKDDWKSKSSNTRPSTPTPNKQTFTPVDTEEDPFAADMVFN